MRHLAALLVALGLWAPGPADASPLCRWLGLCLYLSPGFDLRVVDADTGAPLPGVYAWAEWVQYGTHGTGSPLVVQDAFSDAEGRLTFPRWGPTWGSPGGLPLGRDPAVVLFRTAYETLLLENGVGPGASHHATIRGSSHHGRAVALRPFRGPRSEWVEQIHRLAYPGLHSYVTDSQRVRFAPVCLRRVSLALEELGRLPAETARRSDLVWALERSVRFYRGESR